MDKFEKMVETLEEAEDTVECKECFDLFPKAECEKHEMGGYICPTCKSAMNKEYVPDSRDITFDLYDHDFPEVADYDDRFESNPKTERDLASAFDALVKDEYEAIGAYDAVADVVDETVFDNASKKKSTMKALKHIRDEEEEHIDELRDIADGDTEVEVDEDLFAGTSTKPSQNSTVAPMLNASAEAEVEDEAKPLTESAKTWTCWYEGKDIGKVEAENEEDALNKMMAQYPGREYNNVDFGVSPEGETLVEGPVDAAKRFFKKLGNKATNKKNADTGKTLATLFNKGYVIFCKMPAGKALPAQHGKVFDANNLSKAMEVAKTLSKVHAGAMIYVFALAPDLTGFGQATKEVVGATSTLKSLGKVVCNKAVARYQNNAAVEDITKDLVNKYIDALEADNILGADDVNDDGDMFETDADVDSDDDLSELDDEVAAADATTDKGKTPADITTDTTTDTATDTTTDTTTDTATDTATDGKAEEKPEEKPADGTPAKGSKEDNKKWHGHEVSNKTINAFRKLMRTMNLEVYDAFGKRVGTDIPSLRKINAETLLDFEVVINGKKVPVANWLKEMVKNGVITESFVIDLYGKDLYESFDDTYDSFDDFDDEFEDDIVVCAWCGQDFPKEECRLERDMGYLCHFCEQAIKSRGEELIFVE